MKKLQLLAILGLLSLTQAYGMERHSRPGVNPEQQQMVEELQRLQARVKKPAAVTDSSGATYYKPLPTPPAKKPAAAVAPVIAAKPAVLSKANQELIDKLAEKLTKLGMKITSLNDKIPSVVQSFKSGDVSQMLTIENIKKTFWTGVRSTEAAILITKIKDYIQQLNQTDKTTQQAAKDRVAPILTDTAFTTATRNLEEHLGNLPEPFGSEAKSLVDITKFLKTQFGITAADAAESSSEALEAR